MSPNRRPVVHEEDVTRADDVIRAWQEQPRPTGWGELRGLLIAAFADCRTDAYNDGYDDARNGVGL